MNILFISSLLLFPIVIPGVESFDFLEVLKTFKDSLAATFEETLRKLLDLEKTAIQKISAVVHDDDPEKKKLFNHAVEEVKDALVKDLSIAGVSIGGLIVNLKNVANDIYRPGGSPKKISDQDILNHVEEEATRTRDKIRHLESSISNARFQEISRNVAHLARRISLFGTTMDNATNKTMANEFLEIVKSPSYNPFTLADELRSMVTGQTDNILRERALADDSCSQQSMFETQNAVMELLNKLYGIASVKGELENQNKDISGTDLISTIITETRQESEKWIKNFKILNTCWNQERVRSLIVKVIEHDAKCNISWRVDKLIEKLSKWHTKDKFVVVARAIHGCDTGCAFQESFDPKKGRVVSFHNITVIRSPGTLAKPAQALFQSNTNKNKNERESFTCVNDAEFLLEKASRLEYVALASANCFSVVRSTSPGTYVGMGLDFDDISGEVFSLTDISVQAGVRTGAEKIANTKHHVNAILVSSSCRTIKETGDHPKLHDMCEKETE